MTNGLTLASTLTMAQGRQGPRQVEKGPKLRHTVKMNAQILLLKLRYALGMENVCGKLVFF
jgi:hypothetical protein